jgi:hypothetical protein
VRETVGETARETQLRSGSCAGRETVGGTARETQLRSGRDGERDGETQVRRERDGEGDTVGETPWRFALHPPFVTCDHLEGLHAPAQQLVPVGQREEPPAVVGVVGRRGLEEEREVRHAVLELHDVLLQLAAVLQHVLGRAVDDVLRLGLLGQLHGHVGAWDGSPLDEFQGAC